MIVLMGALKEADLLLSFYQVPFWQHAVLASLNPQEVGQAFGPRIVGALASIPFDEIDKLILLGGDWSYPPVLAKLRELGFPVEKILFGMQPDLIHACLTAFDPRPRQMKDVARQCIYHDVFARPWYAYPLMLALATAERVGLRSFCAFEFGVFRGDGLRNMACIAAYLSTAFEIEIKVLGFDTGTGLPSVADWRDHPELWFTGEMAVPDMEQVRASLPAHAKLYLGDIAQTLQGAVAENVSAACPVGFVSLDVDTYTSSVACLSLFDSAPELLLPVVPLYVDDDYVNVSQTRFAGEGLALAEFNETHEWRKIDRKTIRTNRPPHPWHHAMCFVHVFDHAMRKNLRQAGASSLIGINHFFY